MKKFRAILTFVFLHANFKAGQKRLVYVWVVKMETIRFARPLELLFFPRFILKGYMNRYAINRRLGHDPTCKDFARIHNGGPNGNTRSATLGYWKKIQAQGCTKSS